MAQYAGAINAHIANPSAAPDEEWQRITAALDAVAQQKNSYIAGLYWYTDLDSAKKASKALGKPILSLRLLGKLTDEFSCANSRFFRTVLYPNEEVSTLLHDRFVLHWQSVRPVPTVTIDFGDGRKLERTLTGNSIHYILDSDARPLDALPGLYGPKAFVRGLLDAERLYKLPAGMNDVERNLTRQIYYGDQHRRISAAWLSDTMKIGGTAPKGFTIVKGRNGDALSIAPLAITKAITETSILRAMNMATDELGKITDEAAWKKIAQLHPTDAELDNRSISLIRRQNPTITEDDLTHLTRNFQELIALIPCALEHVSNDIPAHWRALGSCGDGLDQQQVEIHRAHRCTRWRGALAGACVADRRAQVIVEWHAVGHAQPAGGPFFHTGHMHVAGRGGLAAQGLQPRQRITRGSGRQRRLVAGRGRGDPVEHHHAGAGSGSRRGGIRPAGLAVGIQEALEQGDGCGHPIAAATGLGRQMGRMASQQGGSHQGKGIDVGHG